MKNFIPLLFGSVVFVLLSHLCIAQPTRQISGRVWGQDHSPLPAATITLKDSITGRLLAFGISKADGRFNVQVKNIDPLRCYLLIAGHIQRLSDSLFIRFTSENVKAENIQFFLKPDSKLLKEVIIKSQPLPFIFRGDTIEFKAEAYKTPESRKVQDVLRNIQGFSIDSDGKISFNGKTLEKILIDGEDLAEKNYMLISKNLNAEIISRIQVLNNFNDDRLMKEVEASGKVGINLVTDSSYRNRVSGAVEFGTGPEGRIWTDNNLIQLARKIKVLGFLNFNNAGQSGNEDLDYYYAQDMPAIAGQPTIHTSPVNSGQIYPPDIGKTYTRNNLDFSSSAIASLKSGEFVKWKVLISGGQHKLSNGSAGSQEVNLTDQDQWTIHSAEQFKGNNREFIARVSMAHDRKKLNNGSWNIQWINFFNRNNYSNLINGAFSDTLHEYLGRRGKEIQMNGYESFRITQNTVLKFTSRSTLRQTTENFEVSTQRFQDYFLRSPPVNRFDQLLNGVMFQNESDLRMSSRWKNKDVASGFRSSAQHSTYSHDLSSFHAYDDSAINLAKNDSRYGTFSVVGYGMITEKLTRKSFLTGGGNLGMGYLSFHSRDKMEKYSPLFRFALGYEYRPRPLTNLSAEYKISRTVPPVRYFFPDPVINANATISSPADQIVFPQVQSVSVQYVSRNLYRSSGWQLMASYHISRNDYISSMFLRPSYTYHFYIPVDGNRQWQLIGGTEKFHMPVKIKSVLQASVMRMKNKLFVNGVNQVNDASFLRVEGKLLSAYKRWFNIELSGVLSQTWNTMKPGTGDPVTYAVRQYQGNLKFRCRFSEKFYAALSANLYNLAGIAPFHAVDAFLSYTISPKWLLTVNMHNMLNSSGIVQRYTALNTVSEQRYDLVGRYFLLKAAFSF